MVAARTEFELLPEFTAELADIRKNGISVELLYKIIQKHRPNSLYNKKLYNRYLAIYGGKPIDTREPHFEEENPINNKVSNDFFGEIVDFKVGYFAGEPISYSYGGTEEAEEVTGGENAVEKARKALTDFMVRNNMYSVDIETTKNAAIYGYSGRLFYIDREGNERVMPIHGYETIILTDTDISEPEYAVRYYEVKDIDGKNSWVVEFYDSNTITTYKGELKCLTFAEEKAHPFGYCPLQGVANNQECIGDAEKVLSLIDDYDKIVSDNSNEIEAFVHSHIVYENIPIEDEEIKKSQKSGAIKITTIGTKDGKVYYLTKDINDAFTEHHLQRLEDNIYRFSRTPNLADDTFGSASGVSLKFKLHGLETKCSTYEASIVNASRHMWKVLCTVWAIKGIHADPLQFAIEPHRNFPLDRLSEAQTAQALIAAGLPKEWVYAQISGIDDVEYILALIEKEKESAMSLFESAQQMAASGDFGTNTNKKEDKQEIDEEE